MATVYEIITARILEQLQQGVIPWQQPWNHTAGQPRNLLSQKAYRGINVWMLESAGYACPYWLTYRQAQEIGGQVRRGEHGSPVVFWKWLDQPADSPEPDSQEPGNRSRQVPVARLYTVFNAQQCDLPARLQSLVLADNPAAADSQPRIPACEQILAGMPHPPALQHGQGQACYRPAADTVTMPARNLFPQPEHYYSVLFHELTHSTGHPSRLDRATLRDLLAFGNTNYSKEELVAEMGAAYLCGVAGIANETIDNSAGYIQGWLGRLRHDSRLLVQAAAQAQKAADFVLGTGQSQPQEHS